MAVFCHLRYLKTISPHLRQTSFEFSTVCGDAEMPPWFFKTCDYVPVLRLISVVLQARHGGSFVVRSRFSSRWIFHPLDDPYRLFANNDAGSSGIAESGSKFF